jgi:hypothetical protein
MWSLLTDHCIAANILTHDGNAREQKLADLVGQLSIQLCKESFVDGRPSSTILVYFSGVLGFSADPSTFERPRNYTSKLSGLIYCARLCFLEAALPRFAHDSVGWEKRPRHGGLKLLNRVRERYMCLGCQSPFGELLSLRNFGRSLTRSDGPSFRVRWSSDAQTVSWDDGQLSMDQFRALSKTAFDSATLCMERLMYGLRPRMQLDHIRDCMSNQKQGYSFMLDPANKLERAYLELSSRACLDRVDGLMAGDGWDYKSVHRYLEEEDRLLLQLMLILYLCGGQAPRSTELFSIEHCNGPTTSRGLYAHRGAMCFVTRHSKARHSTNQEFQVARYLPRRESNLIFNYLVYIRPFVDMINRECFGSKQERPLFFSSSNDPARPWKVDALTKALKELSTTICGTTFGVQVYRQVSIAVTEKHVKQISRPFDRNDDKSADAAIEVVYAWQSGHRPVQRGTTYGIDSAFPDSLQPALLEVYYWASTEWHKFISVPAPGSVPNIPTGTSHLAKALGEIKASRKRRASESIGEARVHSSPPVKSFSSRTGSIASEKTTSRPSSFLRSCLQDVPDPNQLPKSRKSRKNGFSTNMESGPASGDPPQGATSELDEYRSPWRIFLSSFQNGNTDGDAADMMSQSNANHADPSDTDFGIHNSPATKQKIARFFEEQRELIVKERSAIRRFEPS